MLEKIQIANRGEVEVRVKEGSQDEQLRDLAAVIAALYAQSSREFKPAHAEKVWSAWRWKNRIPQQWNYSGLNHALTVGQD
jgi:head-tail adaptor